MGFGIDCCTFSVFASQESLLTALSDVVKTCTAALKSEDSTVKPAEIVKCCLREARKESLGYKVCAVLFKTGNLIR